MGKIKEALRIWFLAWITVSPALKKHGYWWSGQTTEMEARKVQNILGGPSKVTFILCHPDVVFFSADFPNKEEKVADIKQIQELLPTM